MAAKYSTDKMDVGIALASTWGTAADFTSAGDLLRVSNLSLTCAFGEFTPRDIGFDNLIQEIIRLQMDCSITLTSDLVYDQAWLMLLFAFLGTSTASPSENNVGEGDYNHVGSLQTDTGKYVTLGWTIETDEAVEVPGAMPQSIAIQSGVNGVGTFQCTLLCDRLVSPASVENSVADIEALSYPTYEAAVYGDTNHYLRIADHSTGTALDSGDNMEELSWQFSLNRPLQTRFTSRGANSRYTAQPRQLGRMDGNLSFLLPQLDSSDVPGIVDFLGQQQKMAEIFFDGTQIASGDNRSCKFQFPLLEQIQRPDGIDIPGANQFIEQGLTYRMLAPTVAAAGMAGILTYMNADVVGTRDATWVGA